MNCLKTGMFVISDVVNGPEQSRIISTLGNCNSAYSQLIRDYTIEKQPLFELRKGLIIWVA